VERGCGAAALVGAGVSGDLVQVTSFSGGRTSAYLCTRLLEMFPRERLRFVFMDTGAEYPATYDFIRQVDAHLGLDLVCLWGDSSTPMGAGVEPRVVPIGGLRQDLAPFRSLCGKYGTPTVKIPACTSRLKERTFRKYATRTFGADRYVAWIGVRADEPRRLGKVGDSPYMRFLAEIDDATKQDVLDYWADMPFDLQIPEWLGNCVFCVKKSNAKLALAAREEPRMAGEWAALLADAPDRLKGEGLTSENVYRQNRTLAEVLAQFADVSTDDLRMRVRSSRRDAGTCSESCEPFIADPNQMLMPFMEAV